ncbi:phosphohydrolase (MutT/nudix family protein) [Bacillus cereus VD021]|uniref:Phosphohydrolase (MutT/nudix family protein) n=1 Tax=Bacillus cereus VD021 TaxID=1053224 RepID=R8HWR8_BACCE|nr:NUDIX hydrolase [Bacillus cereus]EOO77373.1 phosphohydrolase (MutT/nudix family protein) [Bacillus cereus VD021]
MGYIEDMRNLVGNHPLILIGSHAIILNEKNEILLQLRTDFNRWGIIGGALEYNETLEDALQREVYEETGLIIKNPELFRTYSGPDFFQIYPNGDQVHGELVCDQTESKELRFFSLDELPSNLPPVIEKIITDFRKSN